ncbi:hypothetical protein V6N13_139208 [Hibiscus sabdariffa]|uniref:Uncharacterized protein n=1 Tax=Hibiscus sabdariffa TaxID=183260 RepID=A0ABR2PL38_9ROSI
MVSNKVKLASWALSMIDTLRDNFGEPCTLPCPRLKVPSRHVLVSTLKGQDRHSIITGPQGFRLKRINKDLGSSVKIPAKAIIKAARI